jgi:hypothetical protein
MVCLIVFSWVDPNGLSHGVLLTPRLLAARLQRREITKVLETAK